MVARGQVRNGVVVLEEGVHLPEGADVTVVTTCPTDESGVPPERRDALLGLIGIWKTANPPCDNEVERIVDEHLQKKYG